MSYEAGMLDTIAKASIDHEEEWDNQKTRIEKI